MKIVHNKFELQEKSVNILRIIARQALKFLCKACDYLPFWSVVPSMVVATFAVANLMNTPDPDERFKRRAYSDYDNREHAELDAHTRANRLDSPARPLHLASPANSSTSMYVLRDVQSRSSLTLSAKTRLRPETPESEAPPTDVKSSDREQHARKVYTIHSSQPERLASAEEPVKANVGPRSRAASGVGTGLVRLARSVIPGLSGSGEGAKPSPSCKSPDIDVSPLPAGRSLIKLSSGCRGNMAVTLKYAGVLFQRSLNAAGELKFELDSFAGTASSVLITFADGVEVDREIAAYDLQRLSKVAVIWKAPVDLDLHAFEYAASFGERGHVWSGHRSNVGHAAAQALDERRGRGFMSTWNTGTSKGDRLEVYTFWHSMRQAKGAVKLGIDYKSRGDRPEGEYCRGGSYAQVDYEALLMSRDRIVRRISGGFAPADCGIPLKRRARYTANALPDIAAAY